MVQDYGVNKPGLDLLKERERVIELAMDVFNDKAKAQQWLDTPNAALRKQRPVDLMESIEGISQVETILGRIAYGVYS